MNSSRIVVGLADGVSDLLTSTTISRWNIRVDIALACSFDNIQSDSALLGVSNATKSSWICDMTLTTKMRGHEVNKKSGTRYLREEGLEEISGP